MRHQRDLHVLAHGHGRERRGDLEGAADAEPPDLARRMAGRVLAEQHDAAAVRALLAVEHVEARALARAVRADQRQDFAGPQRKGDPAHGMDAAIGFASALPPTVMWLRCSFGGLDA